jgi:hypothetical protein
MDAIRYALLSALLSPLVNDDDDSSPDELPQEQSVSSLKE